MFAWFGRTPLYCRPVWLALEAAAAGRRHRHRRFPEKNIFISCTKRNAKNRNFFLRTALLQCWSYLFVDLDIQFRAHVGPGF